MALSISVPRPFTVSNVQVALIKTGLSPTFIAQSCRSADLTSKPVTVAPGQSHVISMAPEFITPQYGPEKQLCEVADAKRWISTHASEFKNQPITLLGDDLFSHQPLIEDCLESGMNFIFTCLPESHITLYERFDELHRFGEVRNFEVSHTEKCSLVVYRYRYANHIPLREAQPAWLVNWVRDILSLTKYLLFDSWQHLIDFMLSDSTLSPSPNSS